MRTVRNQNGDRAGICAAAGRTEFAGFESGSVAIALFIAHRSIVNRTQHDERDKQPTAKGP